MKQVLLDLQFSMEEIEGIEEIVNVIGNYKLERVIHLFKMNNCSNAFIRELIINKRDVFEMDFDKLSFMVESILANGELIEEVILELI